MLFKYVFYLYVYCISFVDTMLSNISGIDTIRPYAHNINDAFTSLFGFFHALLPNTFSQLAWFVNIWFAVWFVFFVARRLIYGLILGWIFKAI